MRRLSLVSISAVSVVAFMQIASAADLPRKAPAYTPPPPFSWTGCYLGGYVGGAWQGSKALIYRFLATPHALLIRAVSARQTSYRRIRGATTWAPASLAAALSAATGNPPPPPSCSALKVKPATCKPEWSCV